MKRPFKADSWDECSDRPSLMSKRRARTNESEQCGRPVPPGFHHRGTGPVQRCGFCRENPGLDRRAGAAVTGHPPDTGLCFSRMEKSPPRFATPVSRSTWPLCFLTPRHRWNRGESIHVIVITDEIVAIPGIAEQIDDGAELIREGGDILFLRQGSDDVPGKFRKALSRR